MSNDTQNKIATLGEFGREKEAHNNIIKSEENIKKDENNVEFMEKKQD